MNIFFLDSEPEQCAKMHCDKHVVKMILEYAQLLSTAHRVLDGDECKNGSILYKKTHANHPSAIWAREHSGNYQHLFELFRFLCYEYSARYSGKVHVTQSKLLDVLETLPQNIPYGGFVVPPKCMPDDCKDELTVVKCYQKYYMVHKASFAKWKFGEPDWWVVLNDVV